MVNIKSFLLVLSSKQKENENYLNDIDIAFINGQVDFQHKKL